VKPLVFALRASPDQRLDLSALLPEKLAGKTVKDIAAIEIGTTRQTVTVGDVFKIRGGNAEEIHFEGGTDKFDRVGEAMTSGQIIVHGDVGIEAGRKMSGGDLQIGGDAGPFAGSCMAGGRLEIGGDAGDFLSAPRDGEMQGMSGGMLIVRGSAGARAGDRLRRGTILIERAAGDWPGSRMVAGTLIILGASGANPGYLMRRGTLVLGKAESLPSTFVDSGLFTSSFTGLFGRFLEGESRAAGRLFKSDLQRFAGDMATLGKGEILIRA
jgi:formylmethanofuran dehydrogenase subunit C